MGVDGSTTSYSVRSTFLFLLSSGLSITPTAPDSTPQHNVACGLTKRGVETQTFLRSDEQGFLSLRIREIYREAFLNHEIIDFSAKIMIRNKETPNDEKNKSIHQYSARKSKAEKYMQQKG